MARVKKASGFGASFKPAKSVMPKMARRPGMGNSGFSGPEVPKAKSFAPVTPNSRSGLEKFPKFPSTGAQPTRKRKTYQP